MKTVCSIRDELEHAFWERLIDADPHAIRVAVRYGDDRRRLDFQIVGCSCGWEAGRESADPDDAAARHVAVARSASGRTSRPTPPPPGYGD